MIGNNYCWRGVKRFDLFASGRIDREIREGFQFDGSAIRYSTDSHLYASGFKYDPFDSLSFRASQSIGFRPPTFGSIRPQSPPTTSRSAIDNRRNNEPIVLSPSQYVSGGNMHLRPERTRSRNLGVIWKGSRGTRVSIDYVASVRRDAISSLSIQEAIDLETDPAIGARISRQPPEPGAPNGVGAIVFVDTRFINFAKVSSKSLDIMVEHSFPEVFGGRFFMSVAASKNISFLRQTSNRLPAVEQVRNLNAENWSQQLRWNGNSQVGWQGRRFTAGISTRFYDYLLVPARQLLGQGSDRAPRAFEHDVFAAYRWPTREGGSGFTSFMSDATISLGIKNAFDREPRYWASPGDAFGSYGFVSIDSVSGRTFWVQLRKGW